VLSYLAGLKSLCHAIIVVFDNDLAPGEREKLLPYAAHVIIGRHGEYDFGSYKRGFEWALEKCLLTDADDLILCNDSCFGPVGSFEPMFVEMDARQLDFWGATDSHEITYHLQSYWLVFSRKVFLSDIFKNFLRAIEKQENVQQVILNYELGLTKALIAAGFIAGAMCCNNLKGCHEKDPSYNNLTLFPIYTLERGVPLVKVKALRVPHTNADGVNRLLKWLYVNDRKLYGNTTSDIQIKRFEDADNISFSLVMPTKDRGHCIQNAILSVLRQTHKNLELIIVDDGSKDDTEKLILENFSEHIEAEKIKYFRLKESVGVCNARNIGISVSKFPWIGYIDSDNVLREYYLTMVANAIIAHPEKDTIYGRTVNTQTGQTIGKSFCSKTLLQYNYIDLGVFIHKKSLSARFGLFDPNLKRLVDWDLIIRLTRDGDPLFLPRVFLEYSDDVGAARISTTESLASAMAAVHAKHSVRPVVTTIIPTYNHQDFLVETIESALAQEGNFTHEILISNDGSTDETQAIVDHYAKAYPNIIRDISSASNRGISENFRYCFMEAAGDFVAILEGDDYWSDSNKIFEQAKFLVSHPEAAMVFSRVELYDMAKNRYRLLKRQDGLPSLLTGEHFAKNEHLNLIANFSSTMIRKSVACNLPSAIYQPRLNEISLAFYVDRIGKIGFIDKVMGCYRQNQASVWTGSDQASQLQQSIAIRENVLGIAKPAYRDYIRKSLGEKEIQLAELTSKEALNELS
jgi:O-antigen biosynthesis protein